MNKLKFLTIVGIGAMAGACSSAPTTNTANTANSNTTVATANTNAAKHADNDETPAAVKAVFPDAQSFTMQHKQLTDAQIAEIEKASGGKVTEKDFHSYLAFTTTGGTRRQLGAATIVKADGKDVIVVYESKDGMPTIKEVRADGVSAEFLKQFVGKNHDAKIVFGDDIKAAGGADEATAKSIAQAVRTDVLTMEALYGTPHSH